MTVKIVTDSVRDFIETFKLAWHYCPGERPLLILVCPLVLVGFSVVVIWDMTPWGKS